MLGSEAKPSKMLFCLTTPSKLKYRGKGKTGKKEKIQERKIEKKHRKQR